MRLRFPFSLSLLLGLLLALSAVGQPALKLDQREHDFGPLMVPSHGTHTFVLTNGGNEPLVIEQVRPTCGCTVTDLDQTTLAPGESARLRAVLEVTRIGPYEKFIHVDTNDPAGRVTLSLQAHGRRIFRAQPEAASLGTLAVGEAASQSISLTSVDGQPFDIKAVRADVGPQPLQAAVAVEGRSDDGASATFKVTARARGYIRQSTPIWLVVDTSHPEQGTVRIPVKWNVRPPFRLRPPRGRQFLGVVTPGQKARFPVSVEHDLPLTLTDSNVSTRGDLFSSDINPSGREAGTIDLVVNVPDDAPEGYEVGHLVVRTGHPDLAVLTVPFSVHIIHD